MKLANPEFKTISAAKSIDIYEALVAARRLQLQPALGNAVSKVGASEIDVELKKFVPPEVLNHVARLGIRGERVFPVPVILEYAPPLIGYYRMLLGLSKKDFGQKLNYGPWQRAEDRGSISPKLIPFVPCLCKAFIAPLSELVYAMEIFEDKDLSDLTLLTLGPTLQGGRNNVIGSYAARAVFESLRTIIEKQIVFDSERLVRFEDSAGRKFALIESSDPDVRVDLTTNEGKEEPIIAIEIKGGEDSSNVHNRAGEAEKSHIKAQTAGYTHRWTVIVMEGVDRRRIGEETPSSTELFEATQVIRQNGADWEALQHRFTEICRNVK